MRERQSRDTAGNADGERGVLGFIRIGIAARVEKDPAPGGGGRGLAIVDRGVELALGEVDQHVAAAADIAGARIGDREREAGRDRGIDGVAAALEHLDADARRAPLLRDHHAMRGRNRLDARAARRRGLGQHRRLRRERSEQCQACGESEQRGAGDGDHRVSGSFHLLDLGTSACSF